MNPPFLAGVILAAGNEGMGSVVIICVLLFLYLAFKKGWDRLY